MISTLLVQGAAIAAAVGLASGGQAGPALPAASPAYSGEVCTISYQMTNPGDCPDFGPGADELALYSVGLLPPRPLPATSPDPALGQTGLSYRRIGKDSELKVYGSIQDALDQNSAQTFHQGFVFVSVKDQFERDGTSLFVTGNNGIVRQDEVGARVNVSRFQGLLFSQNPSRPFGWVVESTHPSSEPGAPPNKALPWLGRYTVIQVYETQKVDGLDWYLVGVGQWVDQKKVGLVFPDPTPPQGVPAEDRWIRINLFEQTLTAYDHGQLVFATLTASGRDPWWTRPGLFQVYKKVDDQPMSGAFAADRSDYYYLQDVPWVLYFDRARAMHGTYWHDSFGYPMSHGCVNLSIGDARWLYQWADIGTWVYVYDPSGKTPTDPAAYANDAAGP